MNRRLVIVARLVAVGFGVLALWLGYLVTLAAPGLEANARNPRLLARGLEVRRGDIIARDGVVLAESVRVPNTLTGSGMAWGRKYPMGDKTAHVIGYYSVRYGVAGLERAYNSTLVGHQGFATPQDWVDETMGRRRVGNDLILTLDSRVQQAAIEALGEDRGAVVALDPRTGAVLALVTSPRFDPATVDERFAELATDSAAPLLDRAIQGLYPPGSTMKMVTATSALADGVTGPTTQWPGPAKIMLGGGKVTNYGGSGYETIAFEDAFARSVNTVFAQIGVKLGATRFVDGARRFGFDATPPFPLTVRRSTITDPADMDTWELAWAAVGQPVRPRAYGGPLATPLEMALIGEGIAGSGAIMEPYLVAETRDFRGLLVSRTRPQRWLQATDPRTAAAVRDLMVRVVEQGSGARAAIDGVTVAGKTGTAELAKGEPHAWFVGFAPADAPRAVVAIVVEHGGVGGQVAAPRARGVLEAALGVTK